MCFPPHGVAIIRFYNTSEHSRTKKNSGPKTVDFDTAAQKAE